MKKHSSKLESTRKTEQDRPCRKFWLLVKGQRKKSKSKSTGPGSKSMDTGPGRFQVSGSGHGSSSRADDVILWRVADVADDVSRAYVAADVEWWRQQQCFGVWKAHAKSTGAWRRYRKPRWRVEVRVTSYDHQILRPSRSVDDKAVWAARGPRRRSGSEESEAARGRFFGDICGVWNGVGWPDFWVFLTRDRRAHLCGWFLQAKAWFAQICKVSGSTCMRDQRCSSEAATEFPWELRDAVDPDLKEGMGTVVDLCYAHENLLCLLEILFDAKNKVWLWYHVKY